jgi:hypothetical protein
VIFLTPNSIGAWRNLGATLSKTTGTSTRGLKYMQQTRRAQAETASSYHQLKAIRGPGNMRLILLDSLKTPCSKLSARKDPSISAPHLVTSHFSHRPSNPLTPSSTAGATLSRASPTRTPGSNPSSIRGQTATSISSKVEGTSPPRLKKLPTQL